MSDLTPIINDIITPITKYTVDGRQFNSLKEAEKYVEERDGEKDVIEKNTHLLDSINQSYIPTWDEEAQRYDIFIKDRVENSGNWDVWQSLVDGREIRYYDTPLQVISPDEFMMKFIENSTIHIDNNEFNKFVRGVIEINEICKNKLDWKRVTELVSDIQVTPVYIYD